MNASAKQQQPKTTATDSFLGMALVSSFLGVAYGEGVHMLFEAGEIADNIWTDRFQAKAQKRTDGRSFELGVKNSLTKAFPGLQQGVQQTLAELDRATFKPSFSTPAFA